VLRVTGDQVAQFHLVTGDGGLLGLPILEGPATGSAPVSASAAVVWGSKIATASSSCVSMRVNA